MLLLLISFYSLPLAFAASENFEEGLRALHDLSQTEGNEVSRNFFWTESETGGRGEWGQPMVGSEAETGIDVEEAQVRIEQARKQRAQSFRYCNLHTHRKGAILRLQRARNELPKLGNRSFPPSGADLQFSLVSEDSWEEWQLKGESAMGVVDSLGLWLYRDLSSLGDDPKRLALFKKFGFTREEIEFTRSSKVDASEAGRYEYMKVVNREPITGEEILRNPAYRKLVLQYAVLEDVELVFLPLEQAVHSDPCRGF